MGFTTNSLTLKYNGLARELIIEVFISKAFDPTKTSPPPNLPKFTALWDTGATNTVISEKVIATCGLKPIGVTRVNTASHQQILSNVYLISLALPNVVGFPLVRVTEGNLAGDADVLIGMDIIATGDFAVTNKDKKTVLSFRHPSAECIDFVEASNKPRYIANVGRNAPCPCGSGKKYKKCCGR